MHAKNTTHAIISILCVHCVFRVCALRFFYMCHMSSMRCVAYHLKSVFIGLRAVSKLSYATHATQRTHGLRCSRHSNFARWCMSVPDRKSPLLGAVLNFGSKFWPFHREYLENGKLQHCKDFIVKVSWSADSPPWTPLTTGVTCGEPCWTSSKSEWNKNHRT